jgi:hypothetical protein
MFSCIRKTIWKLFGAETVVFFAFLLDEKILNFIPRLFLPNIFAGLICGAELWSILASLAILSGNPIFNAICKWGKDEIEKKLKINTGPTPDHANP